MSNLKSAKEALKKKTQKTQVVKSVKSNTKRIKAEDEIVRKKLSYKKIVFPQKIGTVINSRDYDLFRFPNVHRAVIDTDKKFKRLFDILKRDKGMHGGVGLVDKYGNITNGQRRLVMCKRLGIPFSFMLIEKTTHDTILKLAIHGW